MMVTELIVKEASIIGGRQIATDMYKSKNQTLHLCALPLSKLLIFCLECDSNNTTRTTVPRDSRIVNAQMGAFKEELDFSKEVIDQPTGKLEKEYKILIPTEIEMKRFSNAKFERVALAIHNLLTVMMSVDSGGAKNFVEMTDHEEVERSYVVCMKVIKKWIGTGQPGKDVGTWDTGMDIPPMVEIGRLKPDLDLDAAQLFEPSAGVGDLHLPDAPDTKV